MQKRTLSAEPNQHSITSTTIFNAPRDLVFKIMIDPELIPDWWGPRVLTTRVDKMDPWSGGSWRYIVFNSKGEEYIFHGVYHAIETPDRIEYTYEYEAEPGHVSFESTRLEDFEGGTKVIVTSVFQSVQDRDAMLQSDMQEGGNETMERLAELLEKLKVNA